MKRVAEFTLGLIGSILGLIISLITFIIVGFFPAYDTVTNIAFATNGIGILLSIVLIVFACLINKKTKVSSIILIVFSILLFFTNYFQIIPVILLLIAGIMGLVRKID